MKYLLSSIVALAFALPSFAQVTVNGTGTVFAEPDCAHLTFSIATENKGAGIANLANSKATDAFLEVVKKHKIDEKDIATSSFSISPQYDNQGTFKHYLVWHQLSIKVRDVKAAGALIDDAATGNVMVQNISFHMSKQTELEDQARDLAIADAKKKAEAIAAKLGQKLGNIKSISEGRAYSNSYSNTGDMAPSLPGRSFATGSRSVSVAVTAVWEFAKHQPEGPHMTPVDYKQYLPDNIAPGSVDQQLKDCAAWARDGKLYTGQPIFICHQPVFGANPPPQVVKDASDRHKKMIEDKKKEGYFVIIGNPKFLPQAPAK